MQDCGHATPIENRSPAGKAQKQAKRTMKNPMTHGFDEILENRALDRFDGTWSEWFQVGAASKRKLFDCGGIGNLYNAAMELSERQRKYLRGLGHALNPVLLIGNAGVTPAVIAEAKRALHDHELIKVKFRSADRATRDTGLTALAGSTESLLVHRIGHTALYYKRRNDRPGIVIPDA
jgi:RNA-binding protein